MIDLYVHGYSLSVWKIGDLSNTEYPSFFPVVVYSYPKSYHWWIAILVTIMFASFALFIKNCHTVNDNLADLNLSDLSHYEKTCKTSNYRTGTRIEKPGKVTWDDSLSLDTTTITMCFPASRGLSRRGIFASPWETSASRETMCIIDTKCHKMTHKWCNHLPLCLKTSKY